MKTPNLFDVPKDSPSAKEKLDAFKKSNGIETHYSPKMKGFDHPWIAAHLPSARELGYGVTPEDGLVDCIAKVGRLMEESGFLETGETERNAVRAVCENLKITFL